MILSGVGGSSARDHRARDHAERAARQRERRVRARVGRGVAALVVAAAFLAAGAAPVVSAVQTPPPTPVDGRPSPFVTRLRTPAPPAARPTPSSPVAVLADLETGQILYGKAPDRRRPIASVTKLMTSLLVLERAGLDDEVVVGENAAPSVAGFHGSELGLRAGERISVRHLLYGLLLQSANDAAIALAEHVSGSVEAFVRLMNRRAKRLGMRRTRYASPNGLDDEGYSTARDLIVLTRQLYSETGFARIVRTKFYEVPSPGGRPRRIQNRNVLLWLYPGAIGVKTGYTAGARFCLVAAAERDGLRLITVVLGNPDEPFSDSAELLNYGFAAFERRPFVTAGDDLGPVDIPGGRIEGIAGGDLQALVPRTAASEVTRSIAVDPGAGYPPALGERIGVLRVRMGGLELGEIPVLASQVPPPPPPEAGPWWRRTIEAVLEAAGAVVRATIG